MNTRALSRVCGVDEAGRGPLAGPVVACAVILDEAKARLAELAVESADARTPVRMLLDFIQSAQRGIIR